MTLTDITLKAGETREAVLVEDLTRTRLVQYRRGRRGLQPAAHRRALRPRSRRLSRVFAHGMLTMGMTGRALTDWVGEERLLSYGVRFTSQVWPGDTLTAEITVTAVEDGVAHLSIVTKNQDGATVVSGTATAKTS
ncbi:MaoC family dehydratase [Streptomyces sp. KL116D]|uniref:MaoC family dehydratase n=1 Tax=Streptomyces sp. KL116D TaxID=3045152 RepID=UPI0035572B94